LISPFWGIWQVEIGTFFSDKSLEHRQNILESG
jgi:hypothetical protein